MQYILKVSKAAKVPFQVKCSHIISTFLLEVYVFILLFFVELDLAISLSCIVNSQQKFLLNPSGECCKTQQYIFYLFILTSFIEIPLRLSQHTSLLVLF